MHKGQKGNVALLQLKVAQLVLEGQGEPVEQIQQEDQKPPRLVLEEDKVGPMADRGIR